MCPFHHGKRLKSGVAHRPGQVRRKRWHPVSYGCLIMLYQDVPAVRPNFGLAVGSITVGKGANQTQDNKGHLKLKK